MKYNVSNKSHTQEIIKHHGFVFKKSLGQNFLIDGNILDKIVDSTLIDKNTGVIEIGPGIGALTEKLAQKAGKVVAIEIDKSLIPILDETLSDYPNVEVVNADILKTSIDDLISKELNGYDSIKIVANLPYYITSPIIIKLLTDKLDIDSITILIQKEVAERITANPGGKEYGSLTLLLKYYADAKIMFNVPQTVFIPKPNVESSVIQLKIRGNPPVKIVDESHFFILIRACFKHRRKTLSNNLINNLLGKEEKSKLEEILIELNIDGKRRAETLSFEEFASLSNRLCL